MRLLQNSADRLKPRARLRRARACALAWLLVAGSGVGCASIGTTPAPTDPLAYTLEAPNGARGWLFGSLHLGRPNQQNLPPRLAEALDKAKLLVLEIDLSETSTQDLGAAMLALGRLEDGLRLRDVISRETWTAVVTRTQETGDDLAALDRLEPWVVSFYFASKMFESAGFESEHGVEQSVIAHSAEIPMRGLETPTEQFSAFDELALEVQERMLADALAPPAGEGEGIDLYEAWRRGDPAQLEAILFDEADDPQMESFYENTYFRRNHRMARGIAAILEEQSLIFTVVGVGHLLGEEGIPALLEQAGFTVERISSR